MTTGPEEGAEAYELRARMQGASARWKGESLRRRGPNEYRIVTRLPNGIRVTIPLGRFTYRQARSS